jgi:murein tripeptide amidase MpaA
MIAEKYLNFEELSAWVREAAAQHGRFIRLSSLGDSYEGRPLWCLTVTDWESGSDRDRSALWVDGNLHASELSGTNACLHLVLQLVEHHQELLREVAFYIVPRVCPDGAELALAGNPEFLRSSTRPYPYADPLGSGIEPADLNGDGKILWMRVPDPRGPWKSCAQDDRLMLRRAPEDREGAFYQILPEGRWRGDFDRWKPAPAPPRQGLDLNRNFPHRWRPEHQQPGAGPFPASEPEVQHCVRFLTEHPNVCQAITFHTFSGVILRPYSTEPDEFFPSQDLKLYKYFGERGSEITGYPLLCVYHDFRYDPKDAITGTFDDWVYETLGAYAWTVEIWSVLRKAGLSKGFDRDTPRGDHRFIRWFESHPIDEELHLLRWCDEQLGGQGFVRWQPFEHPQLGPVELGGWDMFYLFRNPPPQFLQAELEPLSRWVIWLAQANPRLEVVHQSSESLGAGLHRLTLVIDNAGWLPTYGSKKALERQVTRGLRVRLQLADAELVEGQREQQLGHLEGIASRPESPLWHKGDACDYRQKLTWVVRAPGPLEVAWEARHDRAGTLHGVFR